MTIIRRQLLDIRRNVLPYASVGIMDARVKINYFDKLIDYIITAQFVIEKALLNLN